MKEIFDQYSFSHLPVVEDKLYFGAISREEINLLKPNENTLNKYKHLIQPFYVTEKMNWFEVLQDFATHNTNLMPILNSDKEYIGYYELRHGSDPCQIWVFFRRTRSNPDAASRNPLLVAAMPRQG